MGAGATGIAWQANPTLSIVALALRLAAHLKGAANLHQQPVR
ncbi:hypothetical protein [Paraburkholderia sp. Ac-20340]|nr:hypothetical protein [Paraburkholderia sp. Ac-20340]